jgi:hypothetical protein
VPSDTVNCWIGDPSVASEPSIQISFTR